MDFIQFVPPPLRPYAKDYFGYTVESLNLAGGAVATPTFAVQKDSDFLLCLVTGTARDPANPTVVFAAPALTVLITSSGSGRNLMSRPLDWNNVAGTAQRPFFLPWTKFIQQSSTVEVQLTNLSPAVGGQAYDVRMAFHGFKIFDELEEQYMPRS